MRWQTLPALTLALSLTAGRPPQDDRTLDATLRRLAADAPGTAGVSVVHLESGVAAAVNPAMRFPMMSVYKLPIVVHALRESERGRLDLADTVTLVTSDRRRYAAAIEALPAAVRARAAKAYESDPRDSATPVGFTALLSRLQRREMLNERSTTWLLELMEQMHARDGRIRAGLPAGTPAALRPGTSDLTAGIRAAQNDTGIITLPDGRGHLAIAVFLKGAGGTDEARDAAIARFARAAYDWAMARDSKAAQRAGYFDQRSESSNVNFTAGEPGATAVAGPFATLR